MNRPAADADGPPVGPHPDLSKIPDPVPKTEPRSSRGNPETYEVFGKRYRVMTSGVGYVEDGNASWYGRKFHGRTTSSGEPFDMFALTAAHRSLPIPTYARVTRLDTGAVVVVRVNDRGPFHANRILDLSYAAAVKLGFHEQGTAPVRVEALHPETATPASEAVPGSQKLVQAPELAQTQPAQSRPLPDVYLQAGAFAGLAAADRLANRLQGALDQMTAVAQTKAYVVRTGADDLYRVRIGPVAGKAAAHRISRLLVGANFAPVVILP